MGLLTVKNFNLTIGKEKKIIGGSFEVEPGDVLLLTGSNGCGKSTFIKIIMNAAFDYKNLDCSGSDVIYRDNHRILKNDRENEFFRKNVGYVSQEDEFESASVLDCFVNSIGNSVKNECERYVFDFVKEFHVADCFGTNNNQKLDAKAKRLIRRLSLKENQLTEDEKRAVIYLAMDTRRMSGGQKKLTNIFSNLVRFEFCDLLILDEPLNNLDYGNVRNFSNVLTRIYKSKPNLAIILVTHCRSIPIINRVVEIDTESKSFRELGPYKCNSCFGAVNNEGLYV